METGEKFIKRDTELSIPLLMAEIEFLRAQNMGLRRDGLTGAERFDISEENIKHVFREAYKQGLSITIIMTDIDDFKKAQDERNHVWGDHAIAMSAAGVETCLRKTDILFRYGGDELLAILIGAKEEKTPEIRDRIEHCLDKITIKGGGFEGKISITVGAASSKNEDFGDIQKRAEADLKERKAAKKVGR